MIMKKTILFCLVFQIVSCQNKRFNPTPTSFISEVNVPKKMYTNDSINLLQSIEKEIANKEGSYKANYYDKNTSIIIDTVMYNPTFDKTVFFIIDKVENKKLYSKDWNKENVEPIEKFGNLPYDGYHYNAKAYIGIRNKDGLLQINNFFRLNIDDYEDIQKLRKRQRQMFFEEYAAVNETGFEFNLNDKRFWDNPNVWEKIKK